MKKFDQELASLKRRVVDMGDLAESMIDLAMQGLADRKVEVFQKVLALEDQLDQMQVEIDNEANRLLTVYGPVAGDLRFILMVSRINSELERMGDHAVNMCEEIQLLISDPDADVPDQLHKMAKLARNMVRGSLQAFYTADSTKAHEILAADDLVDALNDQVVRELLAGAKDITASLALILLAKSLERIADQSTNICEEVIYMIQGADIRHTGLGHERAAESAPPPKG
jgi:phosphate transport system protein